MALMPLPGGMPAHGMAINDSGVVVGYCEIPSQPNGVGGGAEVTLWRAPNLPVDVRALLAAPSSLPSLAWPTGISSSGNIVGSYADLSGREQAFLIAQPIGRLSRWPVPRSMYLKRPIPGPSPVQEGIAQVWGTLAAISSPRMRWEAADRIAKALF